MKAAVERIMEPHQPIFRQGDGGCLLIEAYGYVDKVEVIFPEEMTEADAHLNTIFEYEVTQYKQTEEYLFMVPLRIPQGEYTILVKAWKDGRCKVQEPIMWTLGQEESVLDDLRTRLR